MLASAAAAPCRPRPRGSRDQAAPEDPLEAGLPRRRASRCARESARAGGRRARRTPAASGRRDEQPQRPALARGELVAAARQQDPRLKLALEVEAEVGGAPAAEDDRASAGLARPSADRRLRLGRRRAPEDGAGVLDVVVERAVDVGDVAERQRDEREPVIVEVPARALAGTAARGRPLAAEQAGGANDRVRDQQRGEVRVVVAPPCPTASPRGRCPSASTRLRSL